MRVSIGDICEINNESLGSENRLDYIRYIDISSVGTGVINEESILEPRQAPSRAKRVVKPNDTILSTVRPGRRSFYFFKEVKENTIVSTGFAVLRPDVGFINPRYLYYLINLQSFTGYLVGNENGAAYPAVTPPIIAKYNVELPSLIVQEKIAFVLSQYDDLIENNLRRIGLLEESVRILYREWFVHFRFPGHEHTKITNGVPDGWKKMTAFDAMDVMSGGTPKTNVPAYWDGDIPFFTPKDWTNGCYVIETTKNLTSEGLSKCNSKLYPKNTVFITARGTVGNLNLAQCPMAMNQSCYALKEKTDVSQYFLFCAMLSSIEHFKQRAGGAVFDAIVVDTFRHIPFILPEKKLEDLFTMQAESVFNQVENLLLQTQRLKQARDILLPRLMNGEIAV